MPCFAGYGTSTCLPLTLNAFLCHCHPGRAVLLNHPPSLPPTRFPLPPQQSAGAGRLKAAALLYLHLSLSQLMTSQVTP